MKVTVTRSEDGEEKQEELGLGIETAALSMNLLELLTEIKSVRPLMFTDYIHVVFFSNVNELVMQINYFHHDYVDILKNKPSPFLHVSESLPSCSHTN
jgi:hypothetical protein